MFLMFSSLSRPVKAVILTSLGAGVAQSVQRRATVWTDRGNVHASFGAHISSGYVELFLGSRAVGGVKLTIHIHRVPTFENTWSYTPTPPCFFVVGCLMKHTDNSDFA
jgi:hypothetical protein